MVCGVACKDNNKGVRCSNCSITGVVVCGVDRFVFVFGIGGIGS